MITVLCGTFTTSFELYTLLANPEYNNNTITKEQSLLMLGSFRHLPRNLCCQMIILGLVVGNVFGDYHWIKLARV